MKRHLSVITAMVKKDLIGLTPLVLITLVSFVVVPVITNLDLASIRGDEGFWAMLQGNIYWLAFYLSVFLMITLLQLDPADSLNHDWLTRPVERKNWMSAKLIFMFCFIVIPVIISRFFVNLSAGMGPGLAIWYATGIESFESTLLVPLLFMIALLAPSIRKFIMLAAMVFIVFLLPGWSVTQPLLRMVGIELGGDFDSFMWIQGTVLIVAGLLGSAGIYWFHYCRRQSRPAYTTFWLAVAVMFLSVYPPQGVYNWNSAIALNKAIVNSEDASLESQVILEPALACYPAARLNSNNETEQGSQLLTQAAWPTAMIEAAGSGAITFASSVAYRELLTEWVEVPSSPREQSIEWLLSRVRTQAWLQADSLAEPVQLQRSPTAENRFAQISAIQSDYWLLPDQLASSLTDDPTTELVLDIDATLLAPTTYELPVDGQRHDLSALGSCKAEHDPAGNKIDIECLKRGVQPDLVAAQFIGMDSSRVDSSSRAAYIPDAIEFLKRQRYELVLESPSLLKKPAVLMTAYEAERILHKEVVTPGILGNEPEICPLPGTSPSDTTLASSWSDKSSHEVSFISVEPGVRLEVLDWRRANLPEAPTLVLLPGLGATAHSYDVLAEKLAEQYNVIGITRRGVGDSSQPNRGYSIDRLSDDVIQVMDALALSSAILVGHSFGGEELTYLGGNHPDRIDGLIYLDAAYDRVSANSGYAYKRQVYLDRSLPPVPPPRPSEGVSYQAMQHYLQRTGRGQTVPEGEIIASYDLSSGNIKHNGLLLDALMQGIVTPDYQKISAPALALYAVPSSPAALMEAWYGEDDPELQGRLEEQFSLISERRKIEMHRFDSEVKNSSVIAMEDADHWIFLSHETEVLQAMRTFIDSINK